MRRSAARPSSSPNRAPPSVSQWASPGGPSRATHSATQTQDGNELLDIGIDDQDHTAKRIREGEVLAAVTATSSAIPGCNTWPLGRMRYVAAASPGFIARHRHEGITPQALARAPMMSYGRKDALQEQWLQRLGMEGRRSTPRHFLPSNQGYARACGLGMGWGMHPPLMIGAQLAQSRLVQLLPGQDLDIPMYWVHARNAQASLQRLTHCVIQAAAWLDPMERA